VASAAIRVEIRPGACFPGFPSKGDAEQLGVCKPLVAAGYGAGNRLYDLVPGQPEESIIVHRMESTEPEAMMPEITRMLTHDEDVSLIGEWIGTLQVAWAAAVWLADAKTSS